MASATILSQNDRAVLGALFDPEASLTNGSTCTGTASHSTITTATATSTSTSTSPDTIPASIKATEQSAIEALNTAHPPASAITSAITALTTIITTHPTYASAYTNRAQATRLLPSALTAAPNLQSILADLATAIQLCTSPSPVSPSDARVLAAAHTHRGYLLLRAAAEPDFRALLVSAVASLDDVRALGPALSSRRDVLTPAALEEAASREFAAAGRYGSRTAQTLAVKTNPYAKLCGQIVREALQREIRDFYEVA